VEARAERDGAGLGVDLDVAEDLLVVGRDDDVDRLDRAGERLVQVLLLDLQLEERAVDLVDDDDGLDALAEGLAKDGLGLDADTVDRVDDDEGTVGDTEGGRDLGREVDVTRRVDQVDEEVVACEEEGDRVSLAALDDMVAEGGRGDAPSFFCLISPRSSLGSSKYIEMAVDLMVMPRSCSSARVSIARWSPALAEAMMPALDRSESVRVDLPWSTWAMTDTARAQGVSARVSCGAESRGGRTVADAARRRAMARAGARGWRWEERGRGNVSSTVSFTRSEPRTGSATVAGGRTHFVGLSMRPRISSAWRGEGGEVSDWVELREGRESERVRPRNGTATHRR